MPKISALTSVPTNELLNSGDTTIIVRNGGNFQFNISSGIQSFISGGGRPPNANTSISTAGYAVNTGAYVYLSPGESTNLQNSYNGKTIVSNNTASINYNLTTQLASGFSCQIIQNSINDVTISGTNVTLNSYGGLYTIAGQYASAAIQWTGHDTFILAGNLS